MDDMNEMIDEVMDMSWVIIVVVVAIVIFSMVMIIIGSVKRYGRHRRNDNSPSGQNAPPPVRIQKTPLTKIDPFDLGEAPADADPFDFGNSTLEGTEAAFAATAATLTSEVGNNGDNPPQEKRDDNGFCPFCGAPRGEGNFCPFCGNKYEP